MNELTSICVQWAVASLIKKIEEEADRLQNEETVKRLHESIVTEVMSRKEEALNELSGDMEALLVIAKKSIKYLQSEETLHLRVQNECGGIMPGEIPDDFTSEMKALVAMRNLDQVVYLLSALDMIEEECRCSIDALCKKKAEHLMNAVHSWEDGAEENFELPMHRFIPLNPIRRKMVSKMDEWGICLFLWYYNWSEERPEIFDQMVSCANGKAMAGCGFDFALVETILNDDFFMKNLLSE